MKPEIIVSTHDLERLEGLLSTPPTRNRSDLDDLRAELERARVLDDQERRIWKDGTFAETVAFTFQTVTVGFRVPNLVSQVTPWTDVVSPFLDGELLDFAGTLDPHGMADRALQIRWGLDCMPGFDAVPRLAATQSAARWR